MENGHVRCDGYNVTSGTIAIYTFLFFTPPEEKKEPLHCNRLENDVVAVTYLGGCTDTTAKMKSGAENQWKVPDPPPGLNWAERQKFYMDDLRDAIGDEWITPTWLPAMAS